jgi:CBS domain-containing membrane protein
MPLIAGAFGFDGVFLLGSFGAAAVLVYGAPMAEFSQPRNLVVGNLVSALVGVTVAANITSPGSTAVAAAFAVSSSVLFMHLLRSMHPPGGATALIAVVGGDNIRGLGYWYVLFPVLCGTLILLAVALVVNNLSRNPHRHYPVYWF